MDTVIPPVLRDSAVQAETVGRRGRIDWRDLLIFLLAFALLTTVLALSGVFPAREQLTEEQGD
ncbi:MAG: hypothetical protein SVU32_07280, partial [Candidatus Nanohaloarchaea archaeon]|nr:hypothetical protein [Candidatus Nanohaloarchaea archaeon]